MAKKTHREMQAVPRHFIVAYIFIIYGPETIVCTQVIEIPPLAIRTVAAEYYPELPMTAIHSIIQDLENTVTSSVGLVGYR
ncbi:hypothetical protein AYX13_07058 [Cryptococcus neoformans]|nr:hypothetical protein AYX13_07058 [Cryptococcus neoformans var. grubii]